MNVSEIRNEDGSIDAWATFGMGSVDNVYPNPVKANSLTELALLESTAIEQGFEKVLTHVDGYYSSGYMGIELKRHDVSINGQEVDYSTCNRGSDRILHHDHKVYTMNFLYRYSTRVACNYQASSLVELYLKMVREGVRGSFVVIFTTHFRDTPEQTKVLRVIL